MLIPSSMSIRSLSSAILILSLAVTLSPNRSQAESSCSVSVLSVSAEDILDHVSAKCSSVAAKQCKRCFERQAEKAKDLLRILMRMGACAPSPKQMKSELKSLKFVLCPKSGEHSPEPEPSPSPEPSDVPPPIVR